MVVDVEGEELELGGQPGQSEVRRSAPPTQTPSSCRVGYPRSASRSPNWSMSGTDGSRSTMTAPSVDWLKSSQSSVGRRDPVPPLEDGADGPGPMSM